MLLLPSTKHKKASGRTKGLSLVYKVLDLNSRSGMVKISSCLYGYGQNRF
jgi:hypothetical protein